MSEKNNNKKYPLLFKDQIKFLLENEDFFKTFGKYTEPYPDKLVKRVAEEYRNRPFEIHREFRKLPKAEGSKHYYYTVKFVEDNMVSGGCMTSSLFACAVFRTMGFPSAILVGIDYKNVFDGFQNYKDPVLVMHAVCLVKIKNEWFLYDMTRKFSTRIVGLGLMSMGFIPGVLIRDLEDIGVTNKKQMYGLLMYNLRDILLLDLQKDLIFKKFYKYYLEIKEKIEKTNDF